MGGVGDPMITSQGLGLGIAYFASTGNIKNPIFEGIPSLTPEWLLKKVWLKVNGDLEQSVRVKLNTFISVKFNLYLIRYWQV